MKKCLIALAATTMLVSSAAFAADDATAWHPDGNQWMFRIRALGVMPEDTTSNTNLGGRVSLDNTIVPEFDINYFFTKNIASELILATTKHDISAKGTSLGDVNVGSAWVLPPTLLLQYHFTNWENIATPYIGAGVNYTIFYDTNPGVLNNVSYKDNFGYAFQVGVDVPLKDHWYINLDVKKLFVKTTATFNDGAVRANADLDPWLVGAGVGYRF